MHGTWDDKHTIVLKYQTRDSGAGVDIVTPLVTSAGSAVLVDRGWMSTENSGASRPKLPPVTDGPGHRHGLGTPGRDWRSHPGQRALHAGRLLGARSARCCRTRSTGGFLDLAAESPAPAKALGAVELPDDTSNGPHFFYGLQWWFFGALAIFGFCYLVWDELRQRRGRREQGRAIRAPAACRRPRAAWSR